MSPAPTPPSTPPPPHPSGLSIPPDLASRGASTAEASAPVEGPSSLDAQPMVVANDEGFGGGGLAQAGAAGGQELTQAFRMNAEALHRLQEMQGELVRMVQRSDRSELVLQSTGALNETFRNLAGVQRELLRRLGDDKPKRTSPLIPLSLLGLLLVLVGGIAALVEAIRQGRPAGDGPAEAAAVAAQVRQSYVEGQREGERERARTLQRLEEELEQARARAQRASGLLEERDGLLDDLQRGHRAVELENEALATRLRDAQQDAAVRRALESEVTTLQLEKAAHDTVVQRLEKEVSNARAVSLDMRSRLARYGLGLPDDELEARGLTGDAAMGVNPNHRPVGVPNLLVGGQRPGSSSDAAAAEDALSESEGMPVPPATPWDDVPAPSNAERAPPILPPSRTSERAPPRQADQDGARAVPPVEAPPRMSPRSILEPGTMPPPAVRPLSAGERAPDDPRATPLPVGVPPALAGAGELVPVDPLVERDAGLLLRVQERINRLLSAGRGSERGHYALTGLKGVTTTRLDGVTLVHYDAQGRVDDLLTAREVRIEVDRQRSEIHLMLHQGMRTGTRRGRRRLPERGLDLVIARGRDPTSAWMRSGLRLIQRR